MKSKITILILVAISIFTHWRWVFIPKLFGSGDFGYFLKFPQTWIDLVTLPSTWDPIWGNGFGTFNIIMSLYPVYFSIGVLSKLGLDLIWILKVTNFFPLIIITPIASYLLARKVSKSILGGVVGSLVYSYNSYLLLMQKGGILLTVIAYALVPLFFYFTSRSLEESSYKKALLAGLIGFAISSMDFRFFYLVCLLQVLYLIWNLLRTRFHKLIMTTVILFLPIIIAVLLSSYWILPTILSGKINNNIAVRSGLFGGDMSFKQSLAFFHPYWDGGNNSKPGTVQPLPEYLLLLPVLAVFGILKIKRFPELSFYLIVLIFGIILTKQSSPPFPDLYLWLFKNFPGFNAFRESSKFYLYTGLGYSMLLAASTAVFQKSRRQYLKYLPIIFICLVFLLDTKSLINGQVRGMFQPKSIPAVYQTFQQQIVTDNNYGRIMWVPSYSQWSYTDIIHPRVSAYLVYMENLQKMLALYPGYKPVTNPSSTAINNYIILNLFNQDFSSAYLQFLGIKYIAIPPADQVKEDDLFNDVYGLYSDRPALIKFIDALPYLTREPKFTSMDVYSLSQSAGKLFIGDTSLSLEKLPTIKPIAYQQTGSNQYKFKINNQTLPVFLHFSESADLGWTLIEDSKNTRTFPHDVKSEILGFNTFQIDPDSNLEPGTQRNFTLYYAPQKYVNYGLVISVSSFLFVMLGLLTPIFSGKQ